MEAKSRLTRVLSVEEEALREDRRAFAREYAPIVCWDCSFEDKMTDKVTL